MVSPWMVNGTLIEYILKNPQAKRLELCLQVTRGLAYLHRHDIVHGDLKCSNVLVSETGAPKIADFGNTKLKEQSVRFTTSSSAVYSMRWAAPEILSQSSPASKQADVYALGMTIYEAVTGQVPYAGIIDIAVPIEVVIHKRRPSLNDEAIQAHDKQWFRDLLDTSWSWESTGRPRAAQMEHELGLLTTGYSMFIQDEETSISAFCEAEYHGGICKIILCRQSSNLAEEFYYALAEITNTNITAGSNCAWIRLGSVEVPARMKPRGADTIKISTSQGELMSVNDLVVGQLVSANCPVDMAHFRRLLNLCNTSPHQIIAVSHTFSLVLFDCMAPIFQGMDDGLGTSLVHDTWESSTREQFRTQFLHPTHQAQREEEQKREKERRLEKDRRLEEERRCEEETKREEEERRWAEERRQEERVWKQKARIRQQLARRKIEEGKKAEEERQEKQRRHGKK
ncbi:hypothetical protein FRC07_010749 [Ceratobasidium sp. 392]|nr:hypothetical protein FRC07_010749 [Ceratobasidium sp. 392]